MRTLWLHVRNSPIRWALPGLVVLDLAILFLRTRYWVGVWPETGAAAQVPAYLLGVVGAGAAAWTAGAPARHGMEEQLAAARIRPPMSEGYRLGATVVILLMPYLIGQAVGFVLTARTFPPGLHLWLGYLALGLFVTLLSIAVGWTMGKIFGSILAGLVASLAFLLLVGLLDRQGGFIVVSGRPSAIVDVAGLLLRLGSVAALLVALLWVPGSGKLRGRHLPLPIAAIVSLVVTITATAVAVPRQPAGDRVTCVAGPTLLCVWPENEKYVPRIQEINDRIAKLPKDFVVPARMNEVGIDPVMRTGNYIDLRELNPDAAPYFNILEGSPWSYAGDIGKAIADATFEFTNHDGCRWTSITTADTSRLRTLDAWLEAYLVGGGAPDYHTDAPAEMRNDWARGRAMIGEVSWVEQFSWAGREVRELHGRYCQPGH